MAITNRDVAGRAISQARRKLTAGHIDEAHEELRRLVAQHPKRGEARLALAQAQLAQHQHPDAVASATAAIGLLPDRAEPYAVRASANIARGRLAEALRDAHEATLREPWNGHHHLLFARVALARGDYVEAASAAETAVELNERNVDAHRLLADIARRTGQWDIAEDSARAVHRILPNDAAANELLDQIGRLHHGDTAPASPTAAPHREIDITDPPAQPASRTRRRRAWNAISNIRRGQGQPADAGDPRERSRELLTRGLDVAPPQEADEAWPNAQPQIDTHPDALIKAAGRAIDQRRWKEAEHLLQQVLESDPLYFQQQSSEVERLLHQVLAAQPHGPAATTGARR